MVNIEYRGLQPLQKTSIKAPASTVKRIFADSAWAARWKGSERRSRYLRLASPVARELGQKLANLETALSRFSWPKDTPWRNARLVTPAGNDSAAAKISTDLSPVGQAVRHYKYFSRGLDALADAGIEQAATRRFNMTLGGQTRTLSVDVSPGDDWGDVLEATAQAVNDSDLPVQAEVVRQPVPYTRIPDLGKTGAILALSVNRAHPDQNLSLADTSGHLVLGLDLKAPSSSARAATVRRYDVSAARPAAPGTFVSKGFFPEQATTLDPGLHKLAWSAGPESGTASVLVESEMTWKDVLTKLAANISQASDQVNAQVVPVRMSSGISDPLMADGIALAVGAASPKLGERLSLDEYGGPWLDDIDGFFNPTAALPAAPAVGDRYAASATGNGWTENRIYEYDGAAWAETTPTAHNSATNAATGQDWFFDGSAWSANPSGTLTATLGLTATATPGSDASLTVNGQTLASETGTFTRDMGRLGLTIEDAVGETLPLAVVEALDQVANGFAGIAQTYNDLRSFMLANKDLLDHDLPGELSAPLEDREPALDWLGVTQETPDKLMFVDGDRFLKRLAENPDRARKLLADADGLVPELSRAVSNALDRGPEQALVAPSLLAESGPPWARQLSNEKAEKLLDLTSSGLDVAPETKRILDLGGTLVDIVESKRQALSAPPGSGSIISAKS